MNDFFADHRPHQGWTYDAYLMQWARKLERPLTGLDKTARRYHYYRLYNFVRQAGVHNTYTVSDGLPEAVASIQAPQLWMVLTEDWCGDSAFSLPVIAEAAALNAFIDLRILPRDDNLDIMDRYLTNGTSRSIPKLVAFSESGDELFTWGPRPAGAIRFREQLLAEGKTGRAVMDGLVTYYAESEAWRQVDAELAQAIRTRP